MVLFSLVPRPREVEETVRVMVRVRLRVNFARPGNEARCYYARAHIHKIKPVKYVHNREHAVTATFTPTKISRYINR